MFGKAASCRAIVGIVTLSLMVMLPWAAWGGSAPQTLRVDKPSAMESCPIMTDSELNGICGRYADYFFGLEINVKVGEGVPSVKLTPTANLETVDSHTFRGGGDINSNNPVNYKVGIGSRGFYQIAQVNGTDQHVTGLVNLNIEVPKHLMQFGRPLSLSDTFRGRGSISY